MTGKPSLAWVGIILLGGIFIAVFTSVLEMRLTKGDIYPHYATFRTDPLGSSGLYEALGKVPRFTVERNQESLMAIDSLDGDTALFLLGVPRSQFSRIRIPDDSPVLEAIEKNGTRLVLTVDPVSVPLKHINTLGKNEEEWLERRRRQREELRRKVGKKESREKDPEPKKEEKKDDSQDSKEEKEDDDWETIFELNRREQLGPRMEHRFGISIDDVKKFERPEEGWPTATGESIQKGGIPEKTPLWKSQYRFEFDNESKKQWKTAATVNGLPVVAERKLGKGSIVVATDSYFASNEALYEGGDSQFLLWLTGGKKRLVFDETMHGSVETTGAVKLLRQYRLHGFFIGLFVFVLLWAWKSAGSLAPGDDATDRGIIGTGGTVSGEDAKSGLVRLLQRSIPASELIENCLATWKGSQISDLPEDKQQKISEITRQHRADPRANNAVHTWQKIAAILRKR